MCFAVFAAFMKMAGSSLGRLQTAEIKKLSRAQLQSLQLDHWGLTENEWETLRSQWSGAERRVKIVELL